MGFPKVLIIGVDPFNRSNATGITLSNLFEGWDKNCLSQVYISDMLPETDVCNNFYKLSSKTAIIDFYVRKLFSHVSSKKNTYAAPAAATLNEEDINIKNRIHLHIRAIADFSPVILPKELFNWINAFNPDIIYCSFGNARMFEITNRVAKRIRKPIVPHFMDDWPSTLYTQMELFGFAKRILNKRFNSMLSKSNGGLCISELMVNEYENRYHLPFVAFVNTVDDNLFCAPEIDNSKDGLILMYIGGLHLNRWKSLLDISKAIEKINDKQKKITLEIFCPTKDVQLYSNHFTNLISTTFQGSLKSSEVSEKLKRASVLLYVEAFDENIIKYTKFSLSTKIPQYMAAGKPILAYGPGGLASMQLIKMSGGGKVIHESNIESLKNDILNFVSDKKDLILHAQNGYCHARKNYLKTENLNRLKRTLKDFSSDKHLN